MYYTACFLFGLACIAATLAFVRISITAGKTHKIFEDEDEDGDKDNAKDRDDTKLLLVKPRAQQVLLKPTALDHLLIPVEGRGRNG